MDRLESPPYLKASHRTNRPDSRCGAKRATSARPFSGPNPPTRARSFVMNAMQQEPADGLVEAHRLLLADLRDLEEQAGPAPTLAPAGVSECLSVLRARL